MKKRSGGLVYSSADGRICQSCGRPATKCTCSQKNPRSGSNTSNASDAASNTPKGDGIVRVRREVKGRRGKTVTTVSGVPLPEDALRSLASELKRRCATGGSVKNGVIEIQGDHRDRLVEDLEGRGYSVKRSGG